MFDYKTLKILFMKELNLVSDELDRFTDDIEDDNIKNLVYYFIKKKGNLLRPSLIILSYLSASNGKEITTYLIKLAAAVELIHSASLIHDDVIDLEVIRREQKTINHIEGNKVAVLVGNIFFVQALKIINQISNNSRTDLIRPQDLTELDSLSENTLDLIRDMCTGEIIQSKIDSSNVDIEDYKRIINLKTGRLIEFACYYGALIGLNANTSNLNKEKETAIAFEGKKTKSIYLPSIYKKIGQIIGVIYQINDDRTDKDFVVKNESEIESYIDELREEYKALVTDLPNNKWTEMFIKIGSSIF